MSILNRLLLKLNFLKRKSEKQKRFSKEKKIEKLAEKLWQRGGNLVGLKNYYRSLAQKQLYNDWRSNWIKSFLDSLYNYSSIKIIWEKIYPSRDSSGRKEASSFILWILGLHFTAFGIASTRYQNRKDVLETRITVIATQLATDARMPALKRSIFIQQTKIPLAAKITPLWSPYISIFGKQKTDPDISRQIKALIVSEKVNLKNSRLIRADLSRVDLSKANLSFANLSYSDLTNSDLNFANLTKGILKAAKLIETDFTKAKLIGADLRMADLRMAKLIGADFTNATLTNANLAGSDLSFANFTRANLYNTNLSRAALKNINLDRAILIKSDLSAANLPSANLNQAILSYAKLTGVAIPGGDLRLARLFRANLSRANLENANLSETDLSKAIFKGANLRMANLSRANLENADFRTKQLTGVGFLTESFRNQLFVTTIYPDTNATTQGIQTGDRIIAIDGRKIEDLKIDLIDRILFSNKLGRKVKITFLRQSQIIERTLICEHYFISVIGLTPDQVKQAKNWKLALYDPDFRQILGLPILDSNSKEN